MISDVSRLVGLPFLIIGVLLVRYNREVLRLMTDHNERLFGASPLRRYFPDGFNSYGRFMLLFVGSVFAAVGLLIVIGLIHQTGQ
jgi:hypothetical protein